MQVKIEPNNGIPIYEQLVRQIKYAVAEQVVLPGQVIPSVREMARQLAVNPNTVQRAYLQLQEEEVLRTLRGRGMVVAQHAQQRCISDRQRVLGERLEAVLLEAARSGLNEKQLTEMFENSLRQAFSRATTETSAVAAGNTNQSPSHNSPTDTSLSTQSAIERSGSESIRAQEESNS